MYLSYKWLKDFVEIPKSLKAEDLGTKLTVHTVEIDGVSSQAEKFNNVVVGKILEISKHPQADKLQLALVDIKTEKLKIVCGAPNIKVGQVVPVALVGAILPNGMEIKSALIRGEESDGMLCAEDELGLGDDHSGIMALDPEAKLGSPLSLYLGLDDVVFEVDNKSITNRPDLWGHFGMAREIATFLNVDLIKTTDNYTKENIKIDNEEVDIKVKIEDKDRCKRYMAVAMNGIKVEASPKWMQNRLISVGIRPINNIVDISNYVMLELGQPMHIFDQNKITNDNKSGKVNINIRLAKKDEKILCLDGLLRETGAQDLLIANEKDGIAIAGVMGGTESSIDFNTNRVIIESANFSANGLRKTSKRLGLRTEASQRYEKSLDPALCEQAMFRAIELVKKLCPDAKLVSKVIDEGGYNFKEKKMQIELSWLRMFLGEDINDKELLRILASLGFDPRIDDKFLEISIPSWRASKDVSIKEDIAEEVARIYGYDNIKATMPKVSMDIPLASAELQLDEKVRKILSGAPALSEVSNYSFVGEGQLKALGVDTTNFIRLANPISANQTMLRQSMATNLFDNIKKNQARFADFGLFEIGSVFLPIDSNMLKSDKSEGTLPMQEKRLGIIMAGDCEDVYMELKSVVDVLARELGLPEPVFGKREKLFYWSSEKYSGEIRINDSKVGIINLLDAPIAKKIGIKKTVAVAEINLSELFSVKSGVAIIYRQFDKFPSLMRDLAFILDEKILYNDINNDICNFHEYINRVELFDEYHGDNLPKNKKSLAFHIIYQAEKTLSGKEVDDIQVDLIRHLEDKFEAKVRDF